MEVFMLDYEDLKYAHNHNCCSKDSKNTEHRNSIYENIDGDNCEVEYDCYCKECGAYLYSFCYGHYGS